MPAVLQKHVILCVDDEAPVLAALQRVLRQEPYEVFTAESPAHALEILREHEVSLVIADQRMGEMAGSDFLHRVQEISPATLRVMLTGFPDTPVILERVKEGVQRLITKPWRDDDLRDTIRRMLELRRREPAAPAVPPRTPVVRREPENPDVADVVFRIDCAGRTSREVRSELVPHLADSALHRRGAVLLLRGIRNLNESPLPFMRGLIETMFRLEIPTTLIEDSGCADVLPEILGEGALEVAHPEGERRRVLLTGDREETLEVLREILEACGHACDTVTSGSEVASRIEAAKYDFAVFDLDAADPDGFAALKLLRNHGSSAAAIGVCTCADLWDEPTRASLGLRTLLQKPFRVPELLRALGRRGAPA